MDDFSRNEYISSLLIYLQALNMVPATEQDVRPQWAESIVGVMRKLDQELGVKTEQ